MIRLDIQETVLQINLIGKTNAQQNSRNSWSAHGVALISESGFSQILDYQLDVKGNVVMLNENSNW